MHKCKKRKKEVFEIRHVTVFIRKNGINPPKNKKLRKKKMDLNEYYYKYGK